MGTSALSFVPSFVVKRGKFSVSKWLMSKGQVHLRHLRLGWQRRDRPLLPRRRHVRSRPEHHQEGLRCQGQTDEEGKKFAKYDDVVEKVKAAVATPDSQGSYNDYLELLKLYDKNSNG